MTLTNQRLWKQFLNNINPRKPARGPGPDYGIIAKHPANLGNRLWWQQLKCAHHGGSKRFTSLRWQHGEWRGDGPGNPAWLEHQSERSKFSAGNGAVLRGAQRRVGVILSSGCTLNPVSGGQDEL